MASFVALLRAVNVGGTGKLAMDDLRDICEDMGFGAVRTYISSGNVVFTSRKAEAAIKASLEKRLQAFTAKPVGVLVRTAAEMAQVLSDNPFPSAAPNHTVAVFLDQAPAADTLAGIRGQRDEQIQLGRREIYISYGSGMGSSKLVLAAAKAGTARNMNTIASLARMAAES
jgi:uncharacterized protein (DUF1697 family)